MCADQVQGWLEQQTEQEDARTTKTFPLHANQAELRLIWRHKKKDYAVPCVQFTKIFLIAFMVYNNVNDAPYGLPYMRSL